MKISKITKKERFIPSVFKIANINFASFFFFLILSFIIVLPLNVSGQTTFQNCATSTKQIEILRFQNNLSYAPGSNITIFINPKGVYELDNQFKLFLVNGANEVLLSTKDEFYIPILNGIIPTNTIPGTYQLRIKAKSQANATDVETVVTSDTFQVSGNSTSLQNSLLSLPTNGGGLLTLADFIKCLNPANNDYNIGFLNSSGNTPSDLSLSISNSQGGNSAKIFKLNFNSNGTTLDYQLGAETQLQVINNILIPAGLSIGTYLIEYTKTVNGFSMTYGIIFMNNTGNTGLGNETNESVCVGNAVIFSGWKQSISNNYPGSKYKFNFGDGTNEIETTHTKLFECGNILHTFNQETCGSQYKVQGPNPIPGSTDIYYYFRTDLKLLNKYLNVNGTSNCSTYNLNGNGTTKWINANLPPVPDFQVPQKKCVNNSIVATDTSIVPQFGFSNNCLTNYFVKWEVSFPWYNGVWEEVTSNVVGSYYYGWVSIVNGQSVLTIPSNVTTIPGCYKIRLTANIPFGCTQFPNIEKIVIVEPQPDAAFTYTPQANLCAPTTLTFTNTSNTEAIADPCKAPTYTWTVVPVAGTPATGTGFTIIDANGPTVPPAAANQTNPQISFTQPGTYTVTLTVTNVCGTDTFSQNIQIIGDPSVSFSPDNLTICQAQPPSYILDFSNTSIDPTYSSAPYIPTSYNWVVYESNGTTLANASYYNFTGGTSATSPLPKIMFTQYGVYVIKVTVNGNCGGANTASFTFTFKQSPVLTNTALNQAICSSEQTQAIPLTSDILGTTFEWTATTTNSITGFPSGIQTSSTIPVMTLVNNCNTIGIVTFEITPKYNGCDGSKITFTITVNPKPQIPNGNVTICSGEPLNIVPLNNCNNGIIVPSNTTYTWTVADNINVNGDVSEPTAQTSISQALTNTTNTVQTVVYTVTPTSGTCVGSSFTVTVTVNPKPVVSNDVATICSGETFIVNPSNNPPNQLIPLGTKYTWTVVPQSNITGESNQGVAQSSVSQTLINTTNVVQTVVYTVTPTTTSNCIGATFTVTVTVNPKPVISNKTVTICSGDTFTVSPTNVVGSDIVPANTMYTWTVVDNVNVTGDLNEGTPQGSISQNLINDTNVVQTVVYTVTPTSGASGNCVGSTFTVTVTVNPKPVIASTTAVICSGTSFTVTPTNNLPSEIVPTNTTYTWSVVDNPNVTGESNQGVGQTSISQLLTNTSNVVQTVVYTVTPKTSLNCTGVTFTVTVTVNPRPVISNKTVSICSGETFTVTPLNGTVSDIVPINTMYTWSVVSQANVNGESSQSTAQTSVSQTLTNTTNTVQTVIYTVTPTSGDSGNCVGSTFTVTVTVNPKPVISDKTATICSGDTFIVSPTNNAPTQIVPSNTTYTWTVVDNINVNGDVSEPTAQTSISQALTNTTNTVQTVVYTVTPTSGTCVGSSFTVTVTVNPKPVVSNDVATICSGETFTVVPTSSTGAGTYTWTVVNNPNVTGESNQGVAQSSVSQTLINTTNVVQTVVYTVTPTTTSNCIGATFTVTVTVNPKPVISNKTVTICSGDTFTVSPTNVVGSDIVPANTMYTWTVVDNVNVTGDLNEGTPQGSISQNLINDTNVVQTVVYTVTPTSGASGNCVGSTFTVTVTVNPKPVIASTTAVICSGTSFTVTPTNNLPSEIVPTNTTYTWSVVDNPNVTGESNQGVGQTSISQLLTNTSNVVQTVVYTVTPKTSLNCTGVTFTVTVTVNPRPVISNKTVSICSGETFTVTPLNGTVSDIVPINTMYTWSVVSQANVNGESSQSTAQTSVSQTLTNTTNTVQTVIYTVTPTSGDSGNCVGSTFTVTVTVNPKPVISDKTATICSGDTFIVSPTNNAPTQIVPSNTTYTWTVVDNINVNGDVSEPTAQTSISQALTNTTNTVQTVVYTVTPTSGTCVGSSFTVTVTVNPKPVVSNDVATICSGETFTVVPTSSTGAGTYTWTVVNNPNVTGESNQGVAQSSVSQTLINTTNVVQTVVYTVTPTTTSNCIGATFTVTVTVNPKPVISNKTVTICSGDTFTVSPTNVVGSDIVPANTMYTWTVVDNVNVTGDLNEGTPQGSISQNLINDTNVVQTVVYTVTPTSGASGNCVGSTFTVTVTVNPKPVIASTTAVICSGTSFTVTPTNNLPSEIVPTNTTYTWSVVDNPNVTGESNQGVGQTSISQLLTNTSNVVQTVVYTVTPKTSLNCTGVTFTVTVTVNPRPVISNKTVSICSGETFTVTPLNGTVSDIVPINTMYTWSVVSQANVNGESSQSTAQTSVSQTLTNTTNTVQTVIYTVTPTSGDSGNCVGSTFTVTVTVNPKPVISDKTATICSGDTFIVSPTNNAPTQIVPSNTTYTWTVVDNINVNGDVSEPTAQTSISQALTNTTNTVQTVVYTVTPTSGTCVGSSFTVTVTVNPKPVVSNDVATICSGETFTVVPTSSTGAGTYTWTVVNNPNVTGESNQGVAQSSVSQTLINTTNVVQTVVYTVTPTTTSNCIGATFTVTVTVNPKPVISNKTVTICSGDTFTVSPTNVVGSDIVPANTMYTWTVVDNVNVTGDLNEGTPQGSISQNLINDTNVVQTVVYTVTPTSGASGNCVGSTFTVTVTVNPKPVIASTTAVICSGTSFTVTPTNNLPSEIVPTNTTYTWSVVDNPNVTGESNQGVGQTSISQLLTNTSNVVQTVVYTVTPKTSLNCTGVTFTVTVTVNPRPVISNKTVSICSGETFTVTPLNGTVSDIVPINTMYTWSVVSQANVNGESSQSTAQTSVSQTLTNTTNTVQTVIYTVTPTSGDSGNCVGSTFTVTVTVNPEPLVNNIQITRCSGISVGVNFGNDADGPNVTTYNIISINSSGLNSISGNPVVANSVLANEIFDDIWENITTNTVNVVYTVVPVSASGCEGEPFTVTVAVSPNQVSTSNITLSLCSDVIFGYTLPNFVTTYNITNINSNGLTASAGSPIVANNVLSNELVNDAWTNTTSAAVDVVYTIVPVSAAGCSGNPFTVTITINPEPVVANQVVTMCSDLPLGLVLGNDSNGPNVVSYNITNINANGLTSSGGAPIVANGVNSNEIIDDAWRNLGNTAVNVIYTVVPVGQNGCLGNSFTVTATINPEPVVSNQTLTICSDAALGVNFNSSSSVGATSYNVTNLQLNGLVVSAGGAAIANGLTANALANDAFTNLTSLPVNVIYTVVPVSASGCEGESFTVTVTVNPEPIVSNQTLTICSDVALGLTLGNDIDGPSATRYNITNINSNGLTASAGSPIVANNVLSNELVNDAWTNTTSAAVDVVYTIVPVSAAGCSGNPFTVTITINPEPVVANQVVTMCSDLPLGLVLGNDSNGPNVVSYNITNINANGLTSSGGAPIVANGVNSNEIIDDAWRNLGNTAVNVIYTVVPVGQNGCLGNSFTVTATINPEPVVSNQTLTICSDAALGVNFNSSSSVGATSYNVTNLQLNGLVVSAGGAAIANGLTANALANDAFTNLTSLPVNVIYTVVPVSASGCEGESFTVTVTVNPEPIVSNQTLTICSDVALGLTLGNDIDGPSATRYNITNINSNGLTASAGSPIVANNVLSNELVNDAWTNTTSAAVDVVYTIVPVSAAGCSGNPFTVTITINPEPVVANQVVTMCSDLPLGLVLGNDSNGPNVVSYNITNINANGLTSSGGAPIVANGVNSNEIIDDAWRNLGNTAVNVIYTVVPVGQNGCLGNSFTVTATINPEPVVSNQTLTICSDAALGVNFNSSSSVGATSYNVTNLQLNGLVVSAGGAAIANGLTANALANDAFTNLTSLPVNVIYTVVPVSASGCEGESFTVTVTVNPEPIVSNQTLTICSDVALGLTLGNDIDGPSATRYNITNINSNGLTASAGSPIVANNVLSNELVNDAWTNTTSAAVDVVYTIVPVSAAGCSGNPFTVTITINPEPVVANQVVTMCSDLPLGLVLGNDSNGPNVVSYNITNINANGLTSSGGAPIVANGVNSNEIIDDAWRNLGNTAVNVIYTVVPVGQNGCLGNSFTVTATINPEPVVSNQTLTICSDAALGVNFNSSSSVGATSYNVTNLQLNGLVVSAGGAAIANGLTANALANDAFTNLTSLPVNVIYTVVPVSASGCEGESFTVTVTVNPEPIVSNQTLTICSDVALGLTLGNDIDGPSATRYNITNINSNGLTASAGSPIVANNVLSNELVNDAWTNTTSAAVDVVYTIVPVSAAGCSGNPFTVTITINPEPVVANQVVTMCSDLPLGLVLGNDSNGPNVVSYNITNINANGLTSSGGAPIVANGVNSNEIIDDAWRNLGNTAVNVIYTVVPVGQNGCLGNSFTVTATINPEPVVSNQTLTICSDAALGVNFNSSSSVGATSYNVTNLQLNGLVVSAGGAAIANGLTANALANDAFTNLTSLPVNVIYTVVPVSASGCEGESFTVTVTVNPRPKVLNKQFETCSGESFSFIPSNNPPNEIIPLGTTYSWVFTDNSNVIGETNGTNQLQFEQLNLVNISNVNQVVLYTVTATSGNCSSTFEIQMTIKPKPFVPNPSGLTDTRCSGDTFVIIPQNGIPTSSTIIPAGTTYSWTFVDNPNVTGESNGMGQSTITQVLTNLTNVNQSVQYTVTPLSGACQGLPFTVVFWVEPKPFVPNIIETVCDGGSFILTPVNSSVPSTNTIIPNVTLYSWTASTSGNVTGMSSATNQQFFNSGILINNDPGVQTVIYTVTPTYYVPSNLGTPRCIGDPFTITVSVNPGIEDNATVTNISCSYSPLCGGSIVLNPVGIGPFSYNWTYTGTGINAITNPALQNQLNLCPGNYQVQITDALNCTYTFNYVIQPPTPIASTLVTLQNISCNNVNVPPCDGYIELAISGGTPFTTPNVAGQFYTFEWYKETPSGSGTYTLITSGSPILLNACVGNYKLKVIDANGCIHWSNVYQIANQFTLINLVENVSNYNGFEISCFGGNNGFIHNTISGGSGTYNYVFINQTTGSIIQSGTINAPIPTPPGLINLNFNNLTAGTYQLTISDPFCPNNIVRTYVLDQPAQLQSTFTLSSLPVQCFNGTATYTVTATGGTGVYTSGVGTHNLAAGVHQITITDTNGCTTVQTITVTQPSELLAQVSITSPILCYGETAQVTITASGGTGPYTVTSNGIVSPYSGTGISYTVIAGTYQYVVTDANGCVKTVSITVSQPGQLSFVLNSAVNPTCSPDRSYSNGSICITITGGTNPFPVGSGWVNMGNNKWCLNNLTAGQYNIVVNDVNNCPSNSMNVVLTRPTPLQAFVNTNVQVNCQTATVSQNNYVFANGGTPPYTFSWSSGNACNPANPQCMTTTQNGNYIVYVNDAEGIANGCPPIQVPFVVDLITIGQPLFTYNSYASQNCGSLAVNDPIVFTNSSTGDYSSLSWSINGITVSSQENFTYTFTSEGNYTVTLTVNYTIAGVTCTYSTSQTLEITKGYDLIIPNAFTPNGDGLNDTIRPLFKCMDKVEMSIYDTWGSLLYFENGLDLKGWDGKINGKEAENGNYIIVVRATTFAGKELFVNGPVTLLK